MVSEPTPTPSSEDRSPAWDAPFPDLARLVPARGIAVATLRELGLESPFPVTTKSVHTVGLAYWTGAAERDKSIRVERWWFPELAEVVASRLHSGCVTSLDLTGDSVDLILNTAHEAVFEMFLETFHPAVVPPRSDPVMKRMNWISACRERADPELVMEVLDGLEREGLSAGIVRTHRARLLRRRGKRDAARAELEQAIGVQEDELMPAVANYLMLAGWQLEDGLAPTVSLRNALRGLEFVASHPRSHDGEYFSLVHGVHPVIEFVRELKELIGLVRRCDDLEAHDVKAGILELRRGSGLL